MPIQEYCCPEHGKFQVTVSIKDDVPKVADCPENLPCDLRAKGCKQKHPCLRRCDWVPPTVSFPGGPTTGARPPILREDNDA